MKKIAAFALMLTMLAAAVMGCAKEAVNENQTITGGDVLGAPEEELNATETPDATQTPEETQEPDPFADFETPDGIPDEGDEGQSEKHNYERDYQSYASKNSDVVGWISVPNTMIEYPVVITDNNDYYLYHNYDKEESKSGAVFMDYRNADFENSRHVIIYGHNMRNGTMFHDLSSYKLKDFFDQNPVITLYYDGVKYEYEVFAAHVVLADINFIKTNFDSDQEFVDYFAELKSYSKFENDVQVGASDQVLTLSTCSYEYDDSRFVVQARRTR